MKELRIVGTCFFECKLTCKCKVTRANYHKTNTVQAKHQKARITVHHLWNGSASRPRRDMRHTMIQCLISSCCGGEPRWVKPSSGEHRKANDWMLSVFSCRLRPLLQLQQPRTRLGSGVQMLKLRTSESWIHLDSNPLCPEPKASWFCCPSCPRPNQWMLLPIRKCQVSTARGRHPTQHQHLLQPSAILKESKVRAAES